MLTWTPDEQTPSAYADLSHDRNPVHLDPDHARTVGFDGVIVHGMCMLGAASRAAHALAPAGHALRKLDVRFSNPLYPCDPVAFTGECKEAGGSVKVGLEATRGDGERLLRPANFVFAPADEPWPGDPRAELNDRDDDVVGEPVTYSEEQLAAYDAVTRPSATAEGEGVPPMAVLLGMTDALGIAFSRLQPPERKGLWVHLRQQNHFLRPIEAGVAYTTRIHAGRTNVRHGKDGSLVTIPLVVQDGAGNLVSSGSCTLLYAFEKEEA